jgi:hypothetical protein
LRVAGTESERQAAYRLRYEAVVEHAWAEATDFPDGLERDDYDAEAVHVLAWDRNVAVGTGRIVIPRAGRRLPTEASFGLAIEPVGRVANLDRLTVARGHRDREHRVYSALLGRCWLAARAAGFSELCGIQSERLIGLCRELGFVMAVLGPARTHWREERFPVRFDPAASAALVADRR